MLFMAFIKASPRYNLITCPNGYFIKLGENIYWKLSDIFNITTITWIVKRFEQNS